MTEPSGQDDVQDAPPADAPAPPAVVGSGGGVGWRLIAAVALVPWLLGYGITGSWAVARAARALAQGLPHIDAGYTRPVSPAGLIVVGALLLAAFAVLLATALLLLTASRHRGVWTSVLILGLLLLAGAVWAGIAGSINPGLWLVLFFGLVLVAVIGAVVRTRMPRQPGRATIAAP